MKRIILNSVILGFMTIQATAQSGTNSPYSQYGLGVLSDQSQGFNRGMNGLALGMRDGDQVNFLNPASYSAVDSLTMVFDVGLSGQLTNFKEGGKRLNARNADFEYAVAAFRVLPNVGFSAGVVPFTNIGYNYSAMSKVGLSDMISTETYSGSGGIHQAYVGAGWNFFDGFSIGANFSYLWGAYEKNVSITNSDSYVNTVTKTYSTDVSSYKIDFGLQWQKEILKENILTLGLTYGLGHNLGADAKSLITNKNSQTNVSTDAEYVVADGLSIPDMFGAGLSWDYKGKLILGFDYSLQKWGSLDIPETSAETGLYQLKGGLLKDRTKLTFGGEWTPGGKFTPNSRKMKFLSRVNYRFGVSYATPYVTVNGKEGPKEYSVSAGFGIPVVNSDRRSVLNISGQWVHSSAKELITENTFRINVGLTFNEPWFMKMKVR